MAMASLQGTTDVNPAAGMKSGLSTDPGRALWARAGVGAGVVALCAAVSLARQRGAGALDTLWAEDGSIFLQTALADASPRAWLESYAGYLHIAPRMLASLSAILPLDWAPVVLSGGAALVAGALALVTYRAAETHIPGKADRAVLALCLLALPSVGLEVANAAANIHWYLPFAIAWLVLWHPAGWREIAIGCVILFLAAASDPFAVLVAPIIAWRLSRTPRSTEMLWALALGAGIALQAWVMLNSGGSRPLDPLATSPANLARWYGFHVLEAAVLGIVIRDALTNTVGVAGSATLAVAILAFLLAPVARAMGRQPFVPIAFAGLHVAFFLLPVALAGASPPRYAITSILLLYALIAWGLARQSPDQNRLRRRVAAVLLTVVTAVDFAPRNPRADGPQWSDELSQARTSCNTGTVGDATVRIPPRNLPIGDSRGLDGYWTVVIPCDGSVPASEAGTTSPSSHSSQ